MMGKYDDKFYNDMKNIDRCIKDMKEGIIEARQDIKKAKEMVKWFEGVEKRYTKLLRFWRYRKKVNGG